MLIRVAVLVLVIDGLRAVLGSADYGTVVDDEPVGSTDDLLTAVLLTRVLDETAPAFTTR